VGDYQHQGILPLAMRNFLALMGWSPGGDREIMPEDEMIQLFSLEGIQKKPAVFDTAKLEWMNGQYLSMRPAEELLLPVTGHLAEMSVIPGNRDLLPLIDSVKARSRTLLDIAQQVAVRLPGGAYVRDPKAEQFAARLGPAFVENLKLVKAALAAVPADQWKAEPLLAAAKNLAESSGRKLGDILQPVRIALTGATVSEPVNELLAVIGREESLVRLERAIAG
jgi:glutamyl-tRNA synthetase